jgi:hypothetical protein
VQPAQPASMSAARRIRTNIMKGIPRFYNLLILIVGADLKVGPS